MSRVKCPLCGLTNFSEAVRCKKCNTPLASGAVSTARYQSPETVPVTGPVAAAPAHELSPTRTLGIRVTALGGVLSLVGLILLITDSASSFFLVAGIGIAASGYLVTLGKRTAIYLCFATAGMIFLLSFMETDVDALQMLSRPALPALVGVYLLAKVRARLH